MSFGSTIFVMPHVLKELGWFNFIVNVAGTSVIVAFSSILYQESCAQIMIKHKDDLNENVISREPYTTVAKLAVGRRFALVVEVTIFIVLITNALAVMLLTATTMNRVLPLDLMYYNRIRVWLVIQYFATLPFMMYGRYTDLKIPAIVAVLTSSIAIACVLCISLTAKVHYGAKTSQFTLNIIADAKTASVQYGAPLVNQNVGEVGKFFNASGVILFVVLGPSLLLPNIMVLLRKPGKFQGSIILTYILEFALIVVVTTVQYLIFGQRIKPSMIDTLNDVIHSLGMSSYWLAALALVELMLVVHFAMVLVLLANPVFLSIEEKFNFPTSMFSVDCRKKEGTIKPVHLISEMVPLIRGPHF